MPDGTTPGSLAGAPKISELMTPEPVTLPLDTPLIEAARIMRDHAIGDVLVTTGGQVCGVVTDRDIVVRGMAENRDPVHTVLGDVCSANVVTVGPEDDLATAVELMRRRAVRRLPVVVAGRPVGIVSISDLMNGTGDWSASATPPSTRSTLSALPANSAQATDAAQATPAPPAAQAVLSVLAAISKAPPSL